MNAENGLAEKLDELRKRGGDYWDLKPGDHQILKRMRHNISMMIQAPRTSSDMIGTLEHMLHLVPTTRRQHKPQLGVGSLVPDFELLGSHGATLSLKDLRGRRPFAIRLTRASSASTVCPRCVPGLDRLVTSHALFEQAGVELIVVFPIAHQQSRMLVETLQLPYPLYTDDARTLYKAFETGSLVGSPMPAWVVADRDGVVRFLWRSADSGHDSHYVEADDILDVVRTLALK